ncbi:unnamed protein product [Prorocentrum cordatum]|uniref:Uncharacterized protein n=1 Tax=Prorocentrum cordatum TaxID=2364126 RepID=A0ABN9U1V0_9DINO|nr:unnamed protein product [Polarella glacialis]
MAQARHTARLFSGDQGATLLKEPPARPVMRPAQRFSLSALNEGGVRSRPPITDEELAAFRSRPRPAPEAAPIAAGSSAAPADAGEPDGEAAEEPMHWAGAAVLALRARRNRGDTATAEASGPLVPAKPSSAPRAAFRSGAQSSHLASGGSPA